MADGGGFPLLSDTSKTSAEKEAWGSNAEERMLNANAGEGRLGPNSQWLRKVSLIVYGEKGGKDSESGIELSALRVNFHVKKPVNATPNFLYAKIYNLDPKTEKKIRNYQKVQLQAGYQTTNYGIVFDGTVVMYIGGKENPTDTYLELFAGDADKQGNYSSQVQIWPPDTLPSKIVKDGIKAMGLPATQVELKGEKPSLRSTSFIGSARDNIRDHTNAYQSDFFVDDGKAFVIPWEGYRSGEVVNLSPTTGLVSIPKVSPNGIEATCLLNAKLRLAGLVHIDAENLSGIPFQPGAENPFALPAIPLEATLKAMPNFGAAATSPTGTYKIVQLEHYGDTRGNEWYSSMICCAAGEDGSILKDAWSGTALQRSALPSGQAPGAGQK